MFLLLKLAEKMLRASSSRVEKKRIKFLFKSSDERTNLFDVKLIVPSYQCVASLLFLIIC